MEDDMLGFGRSAANLLLAAALVICLQPIYFFAMAHLDRVISHETTWGHISEAFSSSVLGSVHAKKQYLNSGDRFTDCYSLGVGMQPGIDALARGIMASRPATDSRHACEDLRDAAINPESANWAQYARYWHGYRIYSAPLASAVSILTLKLINLALLAGATALYLIEVSRLIGKREALLLCAPVLFCSDFVRIWHVTPHTISTAVILLGGAIFAFAIRRKFSDRNLMLLCAGLGSIFNFVDFLVNPPWLPMLLAFFLIASGRRASIALYCVGVWFAAYASTWATKWLIVSLVDTKFNFETDVLRTAIFRISGDNPKVWHFPFASTTRVALNTVLSWGTIIFIPLLIFLRVRTLPTLRLAWPALIPILWFELLSNHSQIHAFFVSRSMAAAIGVVLAAAALSENPHDVVASNRRLHVGE
jgi:hypothetical protein